MGWRDDIRKSASAVAEAARVAATEATRWAGERAEGYASDVRKARVDEDIDAKAATAARAGNDGTHEPAKEPKALHFDPFDLVAAVGFRERPSTLTYAAMAAVAQGVPVIADVIRTRINQVVMFCKTPEDRHSTGFEVRLRDRSQRVTPVVEAEQQRLERVLLNTGFGDERKPWESVPLEMFARAFIQDSLSFDQGCFEIVPDRLGRPSYIAIVDASTIRLLDPGMRSPGDPYAVQMIAGSMITDFTRDELAFCIRNPRSGIRTFGYGISEIESLVREITGFLWALDYNRRFFSQGAATKGILNFKGTIPDKHLSAFRRQWYAMVTGVNNAWRTPITNAEDLQWISLQMNNRDMEYSAWVDFLIKVCCARYQIAPEEVNFQYGNTGQGQAMGTAPVEEKIKASKGLGLRPLVRWFFTCINTHFLQRINPDMEVIPVGLDDKGIEAETDLLKNQTSVYLTVDEAREEVGLEPLGPGKGDVVLNPTWLQYVQGQQAMQQPGGPGQPGDGPEPPPMGPENASIADQVQIEREDNAPSAEDFDVEPRGGNDEEAEKAGESKPRRRLARYVVDLDQ